MDPLHLSFMNLFVVASCIQEQVWSILPESTQLELEGLNIRQSKCLMSVFMREINGREPYTQSQLGELLNAKKALTSRLLSGLEDRGLVKRTPDPENRRFVRVSPSTKGRKMGQAIVAEVTRLLGKLFAEFNEEERAQMLHLSGKLCNLYHAKRAEEL